MTVKELKEHLKRLRKKHWYDKTLIYFLTALCLVLPKRFEKKLFELFLTVENFK